MKVRMLRTAYEVEDRIFEVVPSINGDCAYAKLLKILGDADSTEQAFEVLKEKGIHFVMYEVDKAVYPNYIDFGEAQYDA